jgi:NADPH:quinone reductase-like Zn-dependent oxidoreductase
VPFGERHIERGAFLDLMATPTVPGTMRAVRLGPPGGVEHIAGEELPTPSPAAGEALVRVHAAAITRNELDWPVDRLPATPSHELSGVVVGLAPDAVGVSLGDDVYALTRFDRDGVAADYVAVPASLLAPKPRTLDHVAAAALPLAGLSAWQGLFDHGGLEAGQRVLVHGAAGGVGHLAVQLAHHHGAHVIATASAANAEWVRQLGADDVIDDSATPFDDAVDDLDLVFDTVGGQRLQRSVAVVRLGGRLVSVAEAPPQAPATLRGVTAVYFIVEPNQEQLVALAALADAGNVRPEIDEVFPLADAKAAFERTMRPGRRGKIVLSVTSDA